MPEPYLPPVPLDKSIPMPGPAFTPAGDNPALVPRPPGTSNAAPAATATPLVTRPRTPEENAALLRSGMGKAPTMMTVETPSPAAPTAPIATAAPAAQRPDAVEPATREPEMRPLTNAEKKALEKARKEEQKAAKEAEKQAERDEKEARKAAERAQKSNKG